MIPVDLSGVELEDIDGWLDGVDGDGEFPVAEKTCEINITQLSFSKAPHRKRK